MTTVLHIDASVNPGGLSRQTSASLVEGLAPTRVIRRDLSETALPQISNDWAVARLVPEADRTAAQAELLRLSDTLVAELQAADVIVIGTPIYNFGMPAALKAWVDLVARPGVTFRYTEGGPVGLLDGKRAVVTVASGGTKVGSEIDFLTPHLRFVLGFIGIKDVEIHAAKEIAAPVAAE